MNKIIKHFLALVFMLSIIQLNAQMIKVTDPYGDYDGDGVLNINDLDNDNDGILDCLENGITENMSEMFAINGNASQVYTDPTNASVTLPYQIQLTPYLGGQKGQLWSRGKIDFNKSFTLRYQAYLGANAGGADGITAVFQNSPAGITATGTPGSGLGAWGIANGIALELDTYNNGMANYNDPNSSHGMIWKTALSSGAGKMTDAVNLYGVDNVGLKDNKWHNVVITWDVSTLTISYTVQMGDGTIIPAGSFTFASLDDLKNNYFGGTLQVTYGYTASTGSLRNDQRIKFADLCLDFPALLDTDGDGTPDYLDLDSDNDGCPDSIEGSLNITSNQVLSSGVINITNNGGVSTSGIPVLAGTNGQGIGYSKIASTTDGCRCMKPGITIGGTVLDTKVGITSLGRAGTDDPDNWPMVRKGGWLALESKTKGFVINRIATSAEVEALPNPQQGMLVFDRQANCLKMYVYKDVNSPSKGGFWKCVNIQACPDSFIN